MGPPTTPGPRAWKNRGDRMSLAPPTFKFIILLEEVQATQLVLGPLLKQIV